MSSNYNHLFNGNGGGSMYMPGTSNPNYSSVQSTLLLQSPTTPPPPGTPVAHYTYPNPYQTQVASVATGIPPMERLSPYHTTPTIPPHSPISYGWTMDVAPVMQKETEWRSPPHYPPVTSVSQPVVHPTKVEAYVPLEMKEEPELPPPPPPIVDHDEYSDEVEVTHRHRAKRIIQSSDNHERAPRREMKLKLVRQEDAIATLTSPPEERGSLGRRDPVSAQILDDIVSVISAQLDTVIENKLAILESQLKEFRCFDCEQVSREDDSDAPADNFTRPTLPPRPNSMPARPSSLSSNPHLPPRPNSMSTGLPPARTPSLKDAILGAKLRKVVTEKKEPLDDLLSALRTRALAMQRDNSDSEEEIATKLEIDNESWSD